MTTNPRDLRTLDEISRTIGRIQAGVEARGEKSSDWQYAATIVNEARKVGCKLVSHSRIRRLIELGKLEHQASDGFGIAVRVK